MTVSVDWEAQIVNIQKEDMELVQSSPEIRKLDLGIFYLVLKNLEDGEDGIPFPDIIAHTPPTILAGVTYSRFVKFVNGYTITFEDGQYAVQVTGANSNIADVMNLNQVSLRTANSAGLVAMDDVADQIVAVRSDVEDWGIISRG